MGASGRTLTQRVASGVAWSAMFQVGRQLLSVISVSVLARKVPPAAYGLVSMAGVLTNFFDVLADLGTSYALIRQPKLTDGLTSAVFWLNIMAGVAISLCLVVVAGPAAWFFHQPDLPPVVRAFALIFLFNSLGVVPAALLKRRMEFRKLSFGQLAAAVTATAVAITAALHDAGVWSLVLGTLANSAVSVALFWFLCPWHLRRPAWGELRSILSYSLNLSGFNILNYVSGNADNMIVGRFLGSLALGYYQMSYTVMTYPLTTLASAICQVIFPGMAESQQDNPRLRSLFNRTCMLIGLFTFPAMFGLAITAEPFVSVVLGPRWLPVAAILVVFGPLGAAKSIVTSVGLIYNAKGRSDWQMRWGIVSSALSVASFLAGLPWGIRGVAVSYTIVWFAMLFPTLAIPFRLIDLTWREFLSHLWPGLKATLCMAIVAAGWLNGLRWLNVANAPIQLFSTVAVGAATYILLLYWWKPPVIEELKRVLEECGNPAAARLARYLP